jgi:hypothetical protein
MGEGSLEFSTRSITFALTADDPSITKAEQDDGGRKELSPQTGTFETHTSPVHQTTRQEDAIINSMYLPTRFRYKTGLSSFIILL